MDTLSEIFRSYMFIDFKRNLLKSKNANSTGNNDNSNASLSNIE